jgi:aspartyl-tRNA(Asn)/glutamyl-tRNA(Gln) amidotransferase subunit C
VNEPSGISAHEVRRIARLANIDLSEEQVGPLTRQMGEILNFFRQLQELDTEGVVPTSHVLDLVNAFRDDLPRPSLPPASSTGNAPEEDSGHFKVPPVIVKQ